MARKEGLEPPTWKLEVSCSNPTELFAHKMLMERVIGIEPISQAWKARAQPLYHTRINLQRYEIII